MYKRQAIATEFMNAKARRAELSRMIDGTQRRRTNEYSSSASKAEFLYVRTQLAIATRKQLIA